MAPLSKPDPCGLPALLQAARGVATLLTAKRLKNFPGLPSFSCHARGLVDQALGPYRRTRDQRVPRARILGGAVRDRRAAASVGQCALIADRRRARRQFVERDPALCAGELPPRRATRKRSTRAATSLIMPRVARKPRRDHSEAWQMHGTRWRITGAGNGIGRQSQPVSQGEEGRRGGASRRGKSRRVRGAAKPSAGKSTSSASAWTAISTASVSNSAAAGQPASGPSARR